MVTSLKMHTHGVLRAACRWEATNTAGSTSPGMTALYTRVMDAIYPVRASYIITSVCHQAELLFPVDAIVN